MENSNSREYLEKITAAVIDNLRQTGPAPSVQMQDVPRRPFGGLTDEEEAELDDLDQDENQDERITQHRLDKRIQNDAEFEPSDDEEMGGSNGPPRGKGSKRTLTDHRKGESDGEGNKSSATGGHGDKTKVTSGDEARDAHDDTMEDIEAVEQEDKKVAEGQEVAEEGKATKEVEGGKLDRDGDVGMTESARAEDGPSIKQEDVDADDTPPSAKAEEAKHEDETSTARHENEVPAEAKEMEQDSGKNDDRAEGGAAESAAPEPMEVDEGKYKEPEAKESS